MLCVAEKSENETSMVHTRRSHRTLALFSGAAKKTRLHFHWGARTKYSAFSGSTKVKDITDELSSQGRDGLTRLILQALAL